MAIQNEDTGNENAGNEITLSVKRLYHRTNEMM